MPSVTATTACCGSRPVAKALGASSGITHILGMGIPALVDRRRTISNKKGDSSGANSLAWYIDKTILSEYQ